MASHTFVLSSSIAESVIDGTVSTGTVTVRGWRGMGTLQHAALQCKTEFLMQATVMNPSPTPTLAGLATVTSVGFAPLPGAPAFNRVTVESSNVSETVFVGSWGMGLPTTYAMALSQGQAVPVAACARDFQAAVSFAGLNTVSVGGIPQTGAVVGTNIIEASVLARYTVEARQFGAGHDNLGGTAFADAVDLGLGNDIFGGRAGNDYAWGNFGRDRLSGEDGDDTLAGMAGNDTLSGGMGRDLLSGGADHDLLMGGAGGDRLAGGTGNDVLHGGDGRDALDGSIGHDILRGDAGNDTLAGRTGDDRLFGGLGDDMVNGGVGNDLIVGEDGRDILIGGEGRDILWGAGALTERDVFMYLALSDSPAGGGFDTIMDFRHGVDRINLAALDGDTRTPANDALAFADSRAANSVWFSNGYVLADVTGDTKADLWIELRGATLVTASDFVL